METGHSTVGRHKFGIFLCLLTGIFFGLSITLAKLAYANGMSPTTFASMRAISAVVVCSAMVFFFKSPWRLPKSASSEVIPVTVLFLMVAFGYPLAMKYVPASIASLTFYLFPLIVLAIGSIKERHFPGVRRISIYLAAFAGLGIVLAPSVEDLQWQGILAGVVAAFGAAFYLTKVPKIMAETNGMVVNVYASAINIVVLLGAAWMLDEFQFPSDLKGWLIALLAGGFYGIAMVLVVFAIKYTNPTLASVFLNLEPLVVAILAAILVAEFLSPVQYAGMVVVIGALMFASRRAVKV